MTAPITYIPDFVPLKTEWFNTLSNELSWEHRDGSPRLEYYSNDFPEPYTYGRGKGQREYLPQPWHPVMMRIREALEALTGATFEVCFLNRYLTQVMHLGWHADDSPEMDDARPIGVVSLGVEREIWFRPSPNKIERTDSLDHAVAPIEKLLLGSGSLCLMAAGMQDEWQHRIPKASFQCGERISLTFRGYVR